MKEKTMSKNQTTGGSTCPCCNPVPVQTHIQYYGVYVNEYCVHVSPNEKGALKHANKLIEDRVNSRSDDATASEFKVSVEKVVVSKKW